jgi:cation/acetate symporter
VQAAEKALAAVPKDEAAAKAAWTAARAGNGRARASQLAGMPRACPAAYAGDPNGDAARPRRPSTRARRNFLALVFCLMLGTAALPHVLTRYYTTPSVSQARRSVGWSLSFIVLLYLSAPALAVMVKYQVFTELVGTSFGSLPDWIRRWSKLDSSLVSVQDINGDGFLQFAETAPRCADMIVLAAPELGGLAATSSPTWWLRAGWRRRCPPQTACC